MKITISFSLDNSAYKHDDGTLDFGQVAETLHALVEHIEDGETESTIYDDNGNTVGRWAIK